jgi:hypothetical protein
MLGMDREIDWSRPRPASGRVEEEMKARLLVRPLWIVMLAGILAGWAGNGRAELPGDETLIVQLVHPERQAARVLSLFEGSRAPHPAAALAAWKRAAGDHGSLGKPLEAAIALFNAEMVREWRTLHEAELRLDLSARAGGSRWQAVVPRDDGSVAAAITAQRLTSGGAEPPIGEPGSALVVERLGPPGGMVATQVGSAVIVASSRAELARALRRIGPARRPNAGESRVALDENQLDSGLVFVLNASQLSVPADAALTWHRAAELLRGLQCRKLEGNLALKGERLALEVTTHLDRDARVALTAPSASVIEPGWLERVPAAGVMGVFSIAIEPTAAFWSSAFSVADRVDRADPAHAGLAPLRSRANLLAKAAGVSLETDFWPHLKGLTACVMGSREKPGIPTSALVVLHVDVAAAAERLATLVLPRFGVILTGKQPQEARPGEAGKGQEEQLGGVGNGDTRQPSPAADGELRRLGMVSGQPLVIWRRGRDVLIGWGEDAAARCRDVEGRPERSVAPLCNGWAREGKHAPQRVGAVWPARCWAPGRNLAPSSTPWQVLGGDPPVVWWGWNQPDSAIDSISCTGLRERVRQFLDQVPLKTKNEG